MNGHTHSPRPYTVLRGRSVGIELDFRLGTCADIRSANPAPISRLRVSFRSPHGRTQHRTVSLAEAALYLRMPKPGDCAQPRSSLSVNGPQKYSSSSEMWTIPGSTGDVCTIGHGSLDFVSREYQAHIWTDYSFKRWERVTLHLDHFRGLGAYQGVVTVVTAGGTVVLNRSTRNIEVTKSTPREIFATVQAGRVTRLAVRGAVRCRIARSSGAAARSTQQPLRLGGTYFGSAGGRPMHFTPRGRFSFGFVLENTTGKRIVVTAAHVVEPTHTLIHQIRARFHRWNPPPCNGMCAPYDPTSSYTGSPFTIRAQEGAAVALNFRFGRCAEIPAANSAPITRFRVGYRTPDGKPHTLVLSLGRAELRLQMPKPEDCAQPRSDLRVQAPDNLFTSSYSTRPGSTGDVCSIAGGTLSFESRLYLLYARERVYVQIPHFAGKGFYTDGIATLVARKKTVFRTETAKVRVTTSNGRVVYAHIFAGHYAHHGEKRVPFKIAGTMRCKLTG